MREKHTAGAKANVGSVAFAAPFDLAQAGFEVVP